jgi:hypothetical protein
METGTYTQPMQGRAASNPEKPVSFASCFD